MSDENIYKVFISSTARDLEDYRQAVHRALRRMRGVHPEFMTNWVSQDANSLDACKAKVEDADIFVGLIGHCFGSAPSEMPHRSYTMLEWDWATAAERPRLMHVAPSDFQVPMNLIDTETDDQRARQRAFRLDELQDRHTGQRDAWSNADRLATDVAIAVGDQLRVMAGDSGFSVDKLQTDLLRRLADVQDELATEGAAKQDLMAETAALQSKLADLDRSFSQAQGTIAGLEADLEQHSDILDPAMRARAEEALNDGDFNTAEAAYTRITELGEMQARRTAAAYFQRGRIAEEQVRWHDAANLYERAARLEPNFDNLKKACEFQWRSGLYHRAEALGKELLSVASAEFGEAHERFAVALNQHALTLGDMGRQSEAEPLYRRAIEINAATIGEAHKEAADPLHNLAILLNDSGHLQDAESLYRLSIDISKKTIGEAHPDFTVSLSGLASLLQDKEEFDEAEKLFKKAIEIDKNTIGEKHPQYAFQLHGLAGLFEAIKRTDEAEQLFRRAIEIDKVTIGEAHPDFAIHLNRLANLLYNSERFDEAEPLYRQTIEIGAITIGEMHPDHAVRVCNLANLLHATERFEEAETLYRQAIEIGNETIGEEHPDYILRLDGLASLLHETKKYDDAELMYQQAIEISDTTLGKDHPDLAERVSNLAILFEDQDRFDDAEPLLVQAHAIYESSFGKDDPKTVSALENLEYLRALQSDQ